ncbi:MULTISPECIES: hypothetical protein [unclassified Mesorhizobium]|uniref:hypothetical protein n=1 Tax=unclassified Mesorhizobium TaxID=325217 RepID=UPI00142EE4FC|nr:MULTISPECIES: hypothetical protein [unclassified Mesorhizobium]
MTIGSTTWHRPTILPLGARASSFANEERHSLRDENTRDEAVLTGLQTDASPWLHKSKTMTAAVDESMLEAPFRSFNASEIALFHILLKYEGAPGGFSASGPFHPLMKPVNVSLSTILSFVSSV